jgi:hypothetical protein
MGLALAVKFEKHFEIARSDIHCERSAELRRGINSKLEVEPILAEKPRSNVL